MKRAVFLDRDGVLIVDKHHRDKTHLKSADEIQFLPGIAPAIRELNKKFLVIIIANQSSVARGLISLKRADELNRFVRRELRKKGCRIDAHYFCPHHPDFSGPCDCRKPKIGLLVKAQKDFGIDFEKSFFIGDKTTDIAAGKKAGCKTILVKTGYGGKDGLSKVTPDFVAQNLKDASNRILAMTRKKEAC